MHANNIQWNDERHTPMLNNYRAIVASWIYDMNTCAPFAATALLYLCMSMQTPTREDALALDAFMRYMAKNIDRPFVIQRPSVGGGTSPHVELHGLKSWRSRRSQTTINIRTNPLHRNHAILLGSAKINTH